MEFGIGSLDVRISAPFTYEFGTRIASYGNQFPSGQPHYDGMIPVFELPASLHLHNDRTGTSKLQFIDMPSRRLPECIAIVERICTCDPMRHYQSFACISAATSQTYPCRGFAGQCGFGTNKTPKFTVASLMKRCRKRFKRFTSAAGTTALLSMTSGPNG